VGTVKGTDAFVAVVVFAKATGGKHAVLAYVCDSKRIAEWFRGSAAAGHFALVSSGGVRLDVTATRTRASGTVTLADGSRHVFSAPAAKRPAGLYRGEKTAKGKHYLGGWIVLPDGRQRGMVKSGSTILASPTLTPTSTSVSLSGVGTITVGFTTPIGHL
jgi:hypothetical protein